MEHKRYFIDFDDEQQDEVLPLIDELKASEPMTRMIIGQMDDNGESAWFTILTPEETRAILTALAPLKKTSVVEVTD